MVLGGGITFGSVTMGISTKPNRGNRIDVATADGGYRASGATREAGITFLEIIEKGKTHFLRNCSQKLLTKMYLQTWLRFYIYKNATFFNTLFQLEI